MHSARKFAGRLVAKHAMAFDAARHTIDLQQAIMLSAAPQLLLSLILFVLLLIGVDVVVLGRSVG